ncbi:hypothetical protein RvY_00251-4 [Ramazzottius varieornatus]|uniref:Uncharacterized protein n=1 Tax=Ramazzottius varieornatus TaxID=947166 RepID=A0A1D1UC48_RAMVA|nr:hypothetical protein RvY_00251-4 [Ramazzottius varieornatus]
MAQKELYQELRRLEKQSTEIAGSLQELRSIIIVAAVIERQNAFAGLRKFDEATVGVQLQNFVDLRHLSLVTSLGHEL